jgi:hypothetical protein
MPLSPTWPLYGAGDPRGEAWQQLVGWLQACDPLTRGNIHVGGAFNRPSTHHLRFPAVE